MPMPKLVSCYYYVVSRNCLNKMNINRRAKTRKTTDNNTNLRLESTVVPERKRGSAVAVQHQGGQITIPIMQFIHSFIHSNIHSARSSAGGLSVGGRRPATSHAHAPYTVAPAPSDVPLVLVRYMTYIFTTGTCTLIEECQSIARNKKWRLKPWKLYSWNHLRC